MSCNHCFLYVAGLLVAFAYGMFVNFIKVTFLYVLAMSICKKVINSDICMLYNADVLNVPLNTFYYRIAKADILLNYYKFIFLKKKKKTFINYPI